LDGRAVFAEALKTLDGFVERTLHARLLAPEGVHELDVGEHLDADAGTLFQAVQAPGLPESHGHLLDQGSLGGSGRLPFGFETGGEALVLGGIFSFEQELAGAEAVHEGVLADGGLSLRGARAGGLLGVQAIGGNLFFGCH